MQVARRVKLDGAVGLQVYRLCVVCRKEAKSLVQRVGMAGEGQGEVRKVMDVDLRLVGARGHDPVAILADTDTLAGFFKVKVLEELDAIRKFGVVLQTPAVLLARVLYSR